MIGRQTTQSEVGKRDEWTFPQSRQVNGYQAHEKMLSISVTRKMQTKSAIKSHPLEWSPLKQRKANAGDDVDRGDPSCAAENIKRSALWQSGKHSGTAWPSNPTSRHLPQRKKSRRPQEDSCVNNHSSVVQNRQNAETAWMSPDWSAARPSHGTAFGHEKEGMAGVLYNISEPRSRSRHRRARTV